MSRVNLDGEKKKVASEVLRKYDVSDTTTPRHNSTNMETEISCAHIGPETKM